MANPKNLFRGFIFTFATASMIGCSGVGDATFSSNGDSDNSGSGSGSGSSPASYKGLMSNLADQLYLDLVQRSPTALERDEFSSAAAAQAHTPLGRSIVIRELLNKDEFKRVMVAQWYKEIWEPAGMTQLDISKSTLINTMLSRHNNGQGGLAIYKAEYTSTAFTTQTRLIQYLRTNNIPVPFGRLEHDYSYVYQFYQDFYFRMIDAQGSNVYSQIANNLPKATIFDTMINAYGNEVYVTVVARWYKDLLRRTATVAELKSDGEVIGLGNEMAADVNLWSLDIKAQVLSSAEYLQYANQ